MRYVWKASTFIMGAAALCGLGCSSEVMAQQQATLPPLQVEAKKSAKAEKSAPAPAASPTVAAPAPAPAEVPLTVSGPPSIGTNTTDITSKDLRELNPADIRGVFTGQPGILVGSSIPMSQKVYVHGVEETNLAVTIDGAIQNNKIFHHNGTNLIDPSLLKAVRVDAGVAPADAGFGALAGAIAYETKDARDLLERDGMGGFAKSSFNTNGRVFTSNLAGYGMSKGFEILGHFTFGDGDEFKAGNGQTVRGTETSLLSGLAKLAYQAPSGDRFVISHERINDDAPRPFRANAGFIDTKRPWEPFLRDYTLDRQTTVFKYTDATPTAFWDPKVVIAYSQSDVTIPVHEKADIYDVSGETGTFNAKVENKFSLPFGSIVTGVDFIKSNGKLFDRKYGDADEQSIVAGAYAQARLEPLKGTRLSFGGRGDHQTFTGQDGIDRDDAGFSGNVSAEQDLIGRFLTVKAGRSHIWAGVPLAENFIMNPDWKYGSGPESVTADNSTAGLVMRHGRWTVEGNIFRTDIDNARIAAYSNGALGAIRTRNLESEGYEIGIGYSWDTGFVRFKYASIDVTIDGQPADTDTGTYLATPVGQIFSLRGVHTFEGTGVTIGGDIEFAPEYDHVISGSPPYKAYQIVNAFIEYRPEWNTNLTLRADVRNIFDEFYSGRANYGAEYVNLNTTPLYEPGRSFILSVTAKY